MVPSQYSLDKLFRSNGLGMMTLQILVMLPSVPGSGVKERSRHSLVHRSLFRPSNTVDWLELAGSPIKSIYKAVLRNCFRDNNPNTPTPCHIRKKNCIRRRLQYLRRGQVALGALGAFLRSNHGCGNGPN
jgi:hypothetical protein